MVVPIEVCIRGGGRLTSSMTISPAMSSDPLSLPRPEIVPLRVGVSFDDRAGYCRINDRLTLIFRCLSARACVCPVLCVSLKSKYS